MRTLRVGIASYEQMKARTVAIARGEYRPAGRRAESMVHLGGKLCQSLIRPQPCPAGTIAESAPESLARLAELTGRKKSNLSRTLKTMERYGFVHLTPGSAGIGDPASSVPADLSDTVVVNTGAGWYRSRMNRPLARPRISNDPCVIYLAGTE
jgi:predicted transcriptional regulator